MRLVGTDLVWDNALLELHALPEDRGEILLAVARMKTPEDVVRVLESYGPGASGLRDERPRGEWKSPVAKYLDVANDLRELIKVAGQVKRAARGDVTLLTDLRREWGEWAARTYDEEDVSQDERFLCALTDWVAFGVLSGMNEADVYFQGGHAKPGTYRLGAITADLLQLCYVELALQLAEKTPIATCAYQRCERPFQPRRRLDLYCSSACASNKRYRDWWERGREKREKKRARSKPKPKKKVRR